MRLQSCTANEARLGKGEVLTMTPKKGAGLGTGQHTPRTDSSYAVSDLGVPVVNQVSWKMRRMLRREVSK